MRLYAETVADCRELLTELEFMWDQIKDIPFDGEENEYGPIAGQIPPWSPLISRFCPSEVSRNASAITASRQYRQSLQQIYSHSRRSTPAITGSEYDKFKHNKPVLGYLQLNGSNMDSPRPSEWDRVWDKTLEKSPSHGEGIQRFTALRKRLAYLESLARQRLVSCAKYTMTSIFFSFLLVWWLKHKGYLRTSILLLGSTGGHNSGKERKALVLKLVLSPNSHSYISRLLEIFVR